MEIYVNNDSPMNAPMQDDEDAVSVSSRVIALPVLAFSPVRFDPAIDSEAFPVMEVFGGRYGAGSGSVQVLFSHDAPIPSAPHSVSAQH